MFAGRKSFKGIKLSTAVYPVVVACLTMVQTAALSQSAVVTNNANPSAAVSTNTTGGTNINYQTNNQWSNEMGFAPGVFCRTPTFYVGAGTGQNIGDTMDTLNNGTSQYSQNYNANLGVLIPFGSTIVSDCKRLAGQIARDREISSDLSMIRACAALDSEGIIVDPRKFPTLTRCALVQGDPPLTVDRAKALQAVKLRQQSQRQSFPVPKTEVIKN